MHCVAYRFVSQTNKFIISVVNKQLKKSNSVAVVGRLWLGPYSSVNGVTIIRTFGDNFAHARVKGHDCENGEYLNSK